MESPAESAARKLARNLGSLKSVDLEATLTIQRLGTEQVGPQAFNTYAEHYIATAAGQRFLEARGLKDGVVVNRSTHYEDRGVFTNIAYGASNGNFDRQHLVSNNRHFYLENRTERKQIPQPLLYFYVGRKPLHEALPTAEALGTSQCLGRECDVFLFPQVRWAVTFDQVFHLDRLTGIPLKVELFRDRASREGKSPDSVWEARSIDSMQGHDIALKSRTTAMTPEGTPTFIWEHSVERIKFDEEIPASTFRPAIQPGVTILDGSTGNLSQAPGPKPPRPAQDAAPVASVRAVPPRDRTGAASTGGVAVGLALLAIGLVVWWRRR